MDAAKPVLRKQRKRSIGSDPRLLEHGDVVDDSDDNRPHGCGSGLDNLPGSVPLIQNQDMLPDPSIHGIDGHNFFSSRILLLIYDINEKQLPRIIEWMIDCGRKRTTDNSSFYDAPPVSTLSTMPTMA